MGKWIYRPKIFLTLTAVGGEWLASRLGHFTTGERAPGTHWIGWNWGGPQSCSGWHGDMRNSWNYWDSNSNPLVVQPVGSCCSDYAKYIYKLYKGYYTLRTFCLWLGMLLSIGDTFRLWLPVVSWVSAAFQKNLPPLPSEGRPQRSRACSLCVCVCVNAKASGLCGTNLVIHVVL
jgi:hypothetical protein